MAREEDAIEASEPEMVTRLGKLLMLSRDCRLNVSKLNVLKRSFGFPDDYLFRLVPNRPDLFRIVNRYELTTINLSYLLTLANSI